MNKKIKQIRKDLTNSYIDFGKQLNLIDLKLKQLIKKENKNE